MNRIATLFAVLAALVFCAPGAKADPIADFYRGKTVRMLIGYGPGGATTSMRGWLRNSCRGTCPAIP